MPNTLLPHYLENTPYDFLLNDLYDLYKTFRAGRILGNALDTLNSNDLESVLLSDVCQSTGPEEKENHFISPEDKLILSIFPNKTKQVLLTATTRYAHLEEATTQAWTLLKKYLPMLTNEPEKAVGAYQGIRDKIMDASNSRNKRNNLFIAKLARVRKACKRLKKYLRTKTYLPKEP